MPRVTHVKKARKNVKGSNIKKGESYYWWKFRYGGKHVSKTPPRMSQLTQSDFLGNMYAICEEIEDLKAEDVSQEKIDEIRDQLEQLRDETQDKLDNMPDQLQEADTGQLLQSRIEGCDEMIDELDQIDLSELDDLTTKESEHEGEDDEVDDEADNSDTADELRESLLSEIQGVSYNGE